MCSSKKKTKKHCNGSWPTNKSKNITEIVSTHNYITINSEQSYGLKNIHFLLLLCNIKSTIDCDCFFLFQWNLDSL